MACPHTEELPNLENPFFGIPGSSSLVFAWGNVVAPMILASLSWMERLSLQAFPRFITHNLHSCTRPQSNMEPEIVGIQVWNLFQQVHAFRLNLTLQGVLCVCVCESFSKQPMFVWSKYVRCHYQTSGFWKIKLFDLFHLQMNQLIFGEVYM